MCTFSSATQSLTVKVGSTNEVSNYKNCYARVKRTVHQLSFTCRVIYKANWVRLHVNEANIAPQPNVVEEVNMRINRTILIFIHDYIAISVLNYQQRTCTIIIPFLLVCVTTIIAE